MTVGGEFKLTWETCLCESSLSLQKALSSGLTYFVFLSWPEYSLRFGFSQITILSISEWYTSNRGCSGLNWMRIKCPHAEFPGCLLCDTDLLGGNLTLKRHRPLCLANCSDIPVGARRPIRMIAEPMTSAFRLYMLYPPSTQGFTSPLLHRRAWIATRNDTRKATRWLRV